LHITAINDYIDYENLLLINNVYYNYEGGMIKKSK